MEGLLGEQEPDSDAGRTFLANLEEASSSSQEAKTTFGRFKELHTERTEIFENFLQDSATETDRLDNF